MFNSSSIALIADRDSTSNAVLSQQLKKLQVADHVVCKPSFSATLAYLHKQRSCSYPLPDCIILNPKSLEICESELLENLRPVYSADTEYKFIFLDEKNKQTTTKPAEDQRFIARISKPISTYDLAKIFAFNTHKI